MVLWLVTKVGWEAQSTYGHLSTLLRGIMIGLVCTFAYDDGLVMKEATTWFAAFQADANDVQSLPSDMRTSMCKIVLTNGAAKVYDAVKSYFYTAETSAERKHVLSSFGSTARSKAQACDDEMGDVWRNQAARFFLRHGVGGSIETRGAVKLFGSLSRTTSKRKNRNGW
jgi:hypothetical protein